MGNDCVSNESSIYLINICVFDVSFGCNYVVRNREIRKRWSEIESSSYNPDLSVGKLSRAKIEDRISLEHWEEGFDGSEALELPEL